MRKILILYTNYGTGHYMAAIAIEEYIKNNYPKYKIEILDPLTYSRPIINNLFAKTGNIVATKFRKFRGKLYKDKMYKNFLKNSWYFMLCTKLFWTKKLQKEITNFNPDIIISTQVGPTGLIASHKNIIKSKLIAVFTDYALHRMYLAPHEFVDLYCVPTNNIKEQMIKLGINENKIVNTGIPVRDKFLNKNIKKTKSQKPQLLFICGGGLGYDNAFKYFELLLNVNYDFNYTFISGKNEKLFKKAKSKAQKYKKEGKVLGYVNDIDEYIKESDLVFGKPGGITTSECLNLNTPLCAIEPIPGQETYNAQFISNNKFGFYIKNLEEFGTLLNKLKNKKINLDDYKKNIENNFEKFSFIKFDEI